MIPADMTLLDKALLVLLFVVSLFFMITAHELGHFIACRRAGITVEEFSIGMFGRPLFKTQRGETTYSFRPVLIGAFVKPAGENDPDVPGGLASQRPWVRLKVFAAGPSANIVLAFVVLVGFFMIERDSSWVEHQGVAVYEVAADSPAEKAGIEPGDFILSIDGQQVDDLEDIEDAMESRGEGTSTFVVGSNGQSREAIVEAEYDPEEDRRIIGVKLAPAFWGSVAAVDEGSPAWGVIQPEDFIARVNGEYVYSTESFDRALQLVKGEEKVEVELYRESKPIKADLELPSSDTPCTAETIGVHNKWANEAHVEAERYQLWQAPVRAGEFLISFPSQMVAAIPLIKENPDTAAVGPIGAGQLAIEATRALGFGGFIFLVALVSLGLALFNFLPMPPLDGGGMLVALVEELRGGKRMSARAMQLAYSVGFAIIITLFVLITYNDIARLVSGRPVYPTP